MTPIITGKTDPLIRPESMAAMDLASKKVREPSAPPIPNASHMKATAERSSLIGLKAIKETPKKPTGSWKTNEYLYFAGDLASTPRLTASLANAIKGVPDSAHLQAIGLTSLLSIPTGIVAGVRGYDEMQSSQKIGDTTGEIFGGINVARAPMEVMGGVTFTAFRGLSIAGTFTAAKSVSTAATIMGNIGSGFFGLTYLFLMIPSIVTLVKNVSFHRKLEKVMEDPAHKTEAEKYHAGLSLMIDTLKGTKEDWEEVMDQVIDDQSLWVDGHVKEIEIPAEDLALLTEEELDYIEERVILEGYDAMSDPKMIDHGKQAMINMKKRKEIEFTRKTGPESTVLIKKAEPLLDALKEGKGVELAKTLFSKINTEKWKNRILHGALIFFCTVGVFALVAGSFATGGALPIVIAVAWVVTTLGMLAIDGYFLYKAYQSGAFDKKDKAMFFAGNALLLLTVGAGIIFSGGIAPLIATGVIGGLWIAMAGYSYYKWNHPSTPQPKIDLSAEEEEERRRKMQRPYRGHAYTVPEACLS